MVVAIISDWDADGVVSAAQVLYSQGILGVYPLRGKHSVVLVPASVRSIVDAAEEIVGKGASYAVVLDIAYSRYTDKAFGYLRSNNVEVLYIDHHISTAIHIDAVKSKIKNVLVGRTSTAMLVYNQLKSIGVDVSERLKAFIEAVTVIERGERRYSKQVSVKLIDIIASLSRALVNSKNRNLWIKVVQWLTEPLPFISLPFALDITKFAKTSSEHLKELKAIANEIALSAKKIFDVRFIDIRGTKYPHKSTAIASALHRLLKTPVVLLARNKRGDDILIIKSRGATAYDLALYLYRKGIAEDIMGHQTLIIMLLKPQVSPQNIANYIREFLVNGPAGI